jgi:cytochrome c-type biogenesis protein CcmH/NrfF
VSQVMHIAKFSPDDPDARILEELACPACGRQDLGDAHTRITQNQMRLFCEDCASFVTIVMSDEQVQAVHRLCARL